MAESGSSGARSTVRARARSRIQGASARLRAIRTVQNGL
jgi:hypothetical protein